MNLTLCASKWATRAIVLFLTVHGAVTLGAEARHNVHHPIGGYTFYVVPHSHMDLEWMWTYDQGEAFSIRILHQALKMLKEDPRFAFTQDQMEALRPFWDSLSDADKSFMRQIVSEGRFDVATGMVVQPDVNEPDFESLTRQFLTAKPWLEKTFGGKVQTAWNVDTFGQTVQMPQLFSRAGIPYFFFSRDLPPQADASFRNLFYWRSPDGSVVLAHLGSYALGELLRLRDMQPRGLKSLEDLIRHNPQGNDKIMIPWGTDEYLPTETSRQIETLVRQAAATAQIPVKAVVISTATRYFQEVEKGGVSLPTYAYDFNPPLLLQDLRGVWGQRPKQKLAERRAEDVLESAEKFSSIASVYGKPYPSRDFTWAWQRILANQNHNTMGGSHADPTNEIAMSRYEGAIEAGRQAQADALFHLSRKIDTSRSGDFPILVFNPLSFPRTEVVHTTRTFFQEANLVNKEVTNFRVLDGEGHPVPFRVLAASRSSAFADYYPGQPSGEPVREAGPISMAEIEFMANDVPALGYRVYRIEPLSGELQRPEWKPLTSEVSSRFFTLAIDPGTGSISKLVDRHSTQELLDTSHYGGNELVLEEEKNPDMEGMIHLTGGEIRASQSRPDSITEMTDDLGTTIRVQAPFMGGVRIQDIRLYDTLPRIDFTTQIKGFPGHDGMLTVLFPMHRGVNTQAAYEVHNAVVHRPDGIFDANTWVDIGAENNGVAILNRGTGGHWIEGENARLILFRSITQYEGYFAPNASEAGDHVFEYSLYPHAMEWSDSAVAEQAHSYNSPLQVISTDAHEGILPEQHSFLSIEGNFEVTAFKKAEEGDEFVLRGHETRGRLGSVQLQTTLPVQQAWEANLLEQPGNEFPAEQGHITFDVTPFEFVTLRLEMKP